jgi:hypothetical protein
MGAMDCRFTGNLLSVASPVSVIGAGAAWWLPQLWVWDGSRWRGAHYGHYAYNTAAGEKIGTGWIDYATGAPSFAQHWLSLPSGLWVAVYNYVYVNGTWTGNGGWSPNLFLAREFCQIP